MMTTHEQLMCELQADVFEKSLNIFNCSSSFFISKFMYSDIAKQLDDIDNPYNYLSLESILLSLERQYPSLNKSGEEKYTSQVLRWLGYIYRAWAILKHHKTSYIYKYMKADKMVGLYDSFHTFGVEYCVDRLEELLLENNPHFLNDDEVYSLFKKMRLEEWKKRGIIK